MLFVYLVGWLTVVFTGAASVAATAAAAAAPAVAAAAANIAEAVQSNQLVRAIIINNVNLVMIAFDITNYDLDIFKRWRAKVNVPYTRMLEMVSDISRYHVSLLTVNDTTSSRSSSSSTINCQSKWSCSIRSTTTPRPPL
uniref:Neurotransmitter-gated ion-channel ligand-binding domain-containing protein n=1 Tax=Glossina palpalis gambiensis TaxID=67801 RepID=A0A1B0BN84_9MUSC